MASFPESMLPNIPCGIFCLGEDGAIVWVNAFFSQLLTYTNDELIGKRLDSLLGIAGKIYYGTQLYPSIMMHGHAHEIFLKFKTSAGKDVPVMLNAVVVATENGKQISCACLPVLNSAAYEAELLAAKKKAEQQLEDNYKASGQKEKDDRLNAIATQQAVLLKQQNDELERLGSIVSHDLQEPLRKLDFYSGRLQKAQNAEEQYGKELSIIQKSALQIRHRLLQLQSFLDVKRDVRLTNHVQLVPIIQKQLEVVGKLFPAVVVKQTLGELPVVKGNPEQLTILFHELIKNAFLYGSVDGILQLEIKAVVLKVNVYQVLGNRFLYEDQVQITLADAGKGIDPDYAERLFEIMNKMNDGDGKLGMGLSICKRIMEIHQGKIWTAGNIGEGAKFFFTLPIHAVG